MPIRSAAATMLLVALSSVCFGQLSNSLFVTEVMWDSSHPGSDDQGVGGHANGDWFELFNASDLPINMSGFRWDDNNRLSDSDGFTVFPNNFFIQPAEAILIVREDNDAIEFEDGFRASWGLQDDVRILGRDTFANTGPEKFSGLSSNGDEVNLYNASGALITSVSFGSSTEGFSKSWGFEGGVYTDFGLAGLNEHGVYRAISDGSEGRLQNTSYVPDSLDLGSPGFVARQEVDPFDLVVSVCSLAAAGERTQADVDATLAAIGSLRGDVDLNGRVEFADFLVQSSSFGQRNGTGTWSSGDMNCDGSVGFPDFLLMSVNFGKSGGDVGTGTATSVPEPSSWLLVMVSLLTALLFVRQLQASTERKSALCHVSDFSSRGSGEAR